MSKVQSCSLTHIIIMDCVFCKIIKKKKIEEVLYETDDLIVIKDLYPDERIHYLIIPKKHIKSINNINNDDIGLMGEMIMMAKVISLKENINGYKLGINVGRAGGQIIDHIHMHLLAK